VALLAGLIGALAASGLGMVSGLFQQKTTVVRAVMATGSVVTLASQGGTAVDWSVVDQNIAPAVVSIQVTAPQGPATGSGLVLMSVDGQAYIVTDSSLVAQGGSIQVTFAGGEQYKAKLVRDDPISGLGVISVANRPPVPGAFLGSVAGLPVASPVLVVGAPTSSGGYVFAGSVSAEDQEVDLASGPVMQNLIAVSGSPLPSPAAAGGPLVNQNGQVVGITLSLNPADSADQNLTYAVPVDVVQHIAQQLIDGAMPTHPWIGVVNADDITPGMAQSLHLAGGAQVGAVWPGSPASKIGMEPNDIITAFNGQPVTSSGVLTELLYGSAQPNRSAAISYLHKGKPLHTTVTVTDQPDVG
jgi:putative serine protease PepD